MKHLWCAIPLLLMLASSSCKKVDEATEFDLTYTSEQVIPGSPVDTSGTIEFVSPDIPTDSESKFAAKGTAKDLISAVKLSKLVITNQSGDLDFLDGFTIYMRADGVSEVMVASKSSVPKGLTSVEAEMTGSNIKDHLLKDKIRLRMVLTVNSLRPQDQLIRIDQTMRVSGKKLSK